MSHYVYYNSRKELENALKKLKIDFFIKEKNEEMFCDNNWSSHIFKLNKKTQKELVEYLKNKKLTLNFLSRSVWISETEDKCRINCETCGIEINTFGKSYIKYCIDCYKKSKN